MNPIKVDINDLDKYFVKSELTPAIAFDVDTKTVLMLAYMNKESLKKTLETGYTWYWSRSRQEYWNKGATSGHLQKVVSIYADCDNDTLLHVQQLRRVLLQQRHISLLQVLQVSLGTAGRYNQALPPDRRRS